MEARRRGPRSPSASGHTSHRGARAVHTVAPSSISAWLSCGEGSAISSPRRDRTRRTLTSTASTGAPNANDATAAAVYGPTPGSEERSSGHPSRATTPAARCSASARRL